MIRIGPEVKEKYPGAIFGTMVVRNLNGKIDRATWNPIKEDALEELRRKNVAYDRKQFLQVEPVRSYTAYYKSFKKTNPVLLQFESIIQKGKGIPEVGIPVEAMFLSEVQHMLLTAGHDLAALDGELEIQFAQGDGTYQGMSGSEVQLTANDLYLTDDAGVLSSILHGPDKRTRITKATKEAMYFVYGVPGVMRGQITDHLKTIAGYLQNAIPDVQVEPIEIHNV